MSNIVDDNKNTQSNEWGVFRRKKVDTITSTINSTDMFIPKSIEQVDKTFKSNLINQTKSTETFTNNIDKFNNVNMFIPKNKRVERVDKIERVDQVDKKVDRVDQVDKKVDRVDNKIIDFSGLRRKK